MQLIGMLDSPYVRRAAITLHMLDIPFVHRPLSVFRQFDEFATINPAVKAPTLQLDDGSLLIDSSLIIDYAETIKPGRASLMPSSPAARLDTLQLIGWALTACEKTVQIVYEHHLRPPEKQHAPWLERVRGQLTAAYAVLERRAALTPTWLLGDTPGQADITTAVAWSFSRHMLPELVAVDDHPALSAFTRRAEQLPSFRALPIE